MTEETTTETPDTTQAADAAAVLETAAPAPKRRKRKVKAANCPAGWVQLKTGKAGRPSYVPPALVDVIKGNGGNIKALATKLQCQRQEISALLHLFSTGKADVQNVPHILENKGELIAAFAILVRGSAPVPAVVNP